jgi:hypothetical protein
VPPAGDVVGVDPTELLKLSGTAMHARTELESVARAVGSLVGGLDGRGWDVGAVQSKWSAARSSLGNLANDLGLAALELVNRAAMIELFESGPGFSVPGYQLDNLSSMSDLFFDGFSGGQFGEKTYSKNMSALAFDGAAIDRLFTRRGKFDPNALATAIAERARQLAQAGSPAGSGRRLTAIDKLDPTLGVTLNLLDANASLYSYNVGGKNASLSFEALAAHANANAGLSLDLRRRRLSASFDASASANLIDAYVHAGEQVGGSMLGGGADVTGQAAVGANADARAGLTMDALKGRMSADVGGDAFAGASATATGSVDADLAGAKTTVTGSATGYAGVGVGFSADGNVDLLHGKFNVKANVGAALGLGVKFNVDLNVDVSGVPHAIASGASSVVHTVEHLVPHVHIGPISFP